jgi:hypothetical protein
LSGGFLHVLAGTSKGPDQFQRLIRQFGRLSDELNNLIGQDTQQIVQDTHHVVLNVVEQKKADKIKEWTSPLNFAKYQEDVFGRAQPETGDWFLKHDKFVKWRDGESGSTLYCPGIRELYLHINIIP